MADGAACKNAKAVCGLATEWPEISLWNVEWGHQLRLRLAWGFERSRDALEMATR